MISIILTKVKVMYDYFIIFIHENCMISTFYKKNLNHFFNDQKASKEAIRPKMFIKNF